MANLKGSKTEDNLKAAFAGESQANRRYLYFAQKADVEGYNDVAVVFRSTAEGETGHAHGHLEFLEVSGDPATGAADRRDRAATSRPRSPARRTSTPTCTRAWRAPPREEGFAEIADWFETLAKAEKSHAGRFQKALDTMALSLTGVEGDPARVPFFFRPSAIATRRQQGRTTMREGSLEAPIRHDLDWQNPWFWRRGCARKGNGARLRHLSRLSSLLQSVRFLPAVVRPDRQRSDRRTRRREEGRLRRRVEGSLHALRHVLHDQVPLRAAARMGAGFPHLMLRHRAVQARKKGVEASSTSSSPMTDRTGRSAPSSPRPRQLGERRAQHDDARTAWSDWPASITARACRTTPARPSRSGRRARRRVLNEAAPAFGKRKAVLYATCFVNFNSTDIGAAAQQSWPRTASRPRSCIRLAAACRELELGDIASVAAAARRGVGGAAAAGSTQGYDIIALTPSCALMLKFEWPLIVPRDPAVERLSQTPRSTFPSTSSTSPAKHGLAPGLKAARGRRQRPSRLPCAGAEHGREGGRNAAAGAEDARGGDRALQRPWRHLGRAHRELRDRGEGRASPPRRPRIKNDTSFVASECPLAADHLMQVMEMTAGDQMPKPSRAEPSDRTSGAGLWA